MYSYHNLIDEKIENLNGKGKKILKLGIKPKLT